MVAKVRSKNPGRPIARCVDDIERVAGTTWTRDAQDREVWQKQRETVYLAVGTRLT